MEGSQHLYVGALFLSPFDEKMRLRKAKVAAEATQLEDVRRMQAVPCLLSTVPCLIHICSLATGDGKIVFPSGKWGLRGSRNPASASSNKLLGHESLRVAVLYWDAWGRKGTRSLSTCDAPHSVGHWEMR